MFEYRRLRQKFGLSGPVLAVVAAIALLVGLTAVSLWRTAGEANRVDDERTARAVANALNAELAQLEAISTDNAVWDDAAQALAQPSDAEPFALRTWLDSTADATSYDAVMAINAQGQPLFALSAGRTLPRGNQLWAAAQTAQLIAHAEAHGGSATAIIRNGRAIQLIGLTRVRPSTAALAASYPRQAPWLIFSRPLSGEALERIGDALILSRLQLSPAPAEPTEQSVQIRDVNGSVVGHLNWRASLPGNQALWRTAPFMAVALLFALIAVFALLRRSFQAVQELNRIALLDALCEMPNRRALKAAMNKAHSRRQPMALAFIDLDGFKAVNDNFGHGVGDQLIVNCARLVTDVAPAGGLVARLGGDEFAMLAIGERAEDRLKKSVEQLLVRIQEPFHIGERTIAVGASVGMTRDPAAHHSASEMMRHADIAMYSAKRSGKGRAHWYSEELDERRAEAFAIEQRLRNGLTNGEFSVHYQPMIDARSGQIVALEALLRWESDGIAYAPDVFIPIAEESGLIDRLGLLVLEQACRDGQQWPDVAMSVNISAAQLRNPEFASWLGNVLQQTGFPPDRLMIEITETYVVHEPTLAARILTEIQQLGVRIALDDFGTGFASIGFLRRFRFDTLKLDRSLVKDASGDDGAHTMLQASIAVARALGMTTVAEGVENDAQALIVQVAGCDAMQGWHYAAALPPEDVTALVERRTVAPIQPAAKGVAG